MHSRHLNDSCMHTHSMLASRKKQIKDREWSSQKDKRRAGRKEGKKKDTLSDEFYP